MGKNLFLLIFLKIYKHLQLEKNLQIKKSSQAIYFFLEQSNEGGANHRSSIRGLPQDVSSEQAPEES